MATWSVQFTNDPYADFRLYLELLEDGEVKGELQRHADGQLRLRFYQAVADVPWEWLAGIVERFKNDGL